MITMRHIQTAIVFVLRFVIVLFASVYVVSVPGFIFRMTDTFANQQFQGNVVAGLVEAVIITAALLWVPWSAWKGVSLFHRSEISVNPTIGDTRDAFAQYSSRRTRNS